jgi:uncharacterized membrane protein YidH (DUF202 family)
MADLRDYLAAEPTFLAWIRGSIVLMGCGYSEMMRKAIWHLTQKMES